MSRPRSSGRGTATRRSPARARPFGPQHTPALWLLLLLLGGALLEAPGCRAPGPRAAAPPAAATEPKGFEPTKAERERLDRLHEALAGPPQELLPEPAQAGGLMVRLAFDTAADLDLFVTDPLQESVYFGNTPSRSGGRLLWDQRCLDPAPRVEAVHWASPPAGRYRVGIDFHALCEKSGLSRRAARRGLYVLRIDDGERSLRHEGVVEPWRFEVIVLEFDVAR